MKKTPYQTLREELISWISFYTELKHLDVPINNEAKAGYFTVLDIKGESMGKSREVEYYIIRYYNHKGKVISNYTDVHNSICEVRTEIFDSIADNYESSDASIIDFDYLKYEYDYEKGILELLYSFDFERQYYKEID